MVEKLLVPTASEASERPSPSSRELERQLLRRGVRALAAERHRCADCLRTPLVGERAYLYESGDVVCQLCRPARREDPVRAAVVRHSELGQTVRLRGAA
jgi:hypothetical protein